MLAISKEERINDFQSKICFIIGDCFKCFFILQSKEIISMKIHIIELLKLVSKYNNFIRINQYTIINTVYFVDIHESKNRTIIMKTGNILKVSRRNWIHFKKN